MKTAIGSAFKQIKENISDDIRNGREMSAGNVAERKERVEHTEMADEHIQLRRDRKAGKRVLLELL